MNTNSVSQFKPLPAATQAALTQAEISFLAEKKSWELLSLVVSIFGLTFGYLIYFSLKIESNFVILLTVTITLIFSVPIIRSVKKLARISRDLRDNSKIIFTTEIEDYQQIDLRDRRGNVTSSDYFLIFEGEKYQVKEENFFKFGCGDTVRVSAAPNSKFVFGVEKIAAAPRSNETLVHFTSPLY